MDTKMRSRLRSQLGLLAGLPNTALLAALLAIAPRTGAAAGVDLVSIESPVAPLYFFATSAAPVAFVVRAASRLGFRRPSPGASAAHSSAGVAGGPVGVRLAERMPVLAVRLPGILGRSADSPKNIDPAGYGFHVGGVDAAVVTAEMVDVEAKGNGSDQTLVGEAMRHHLDTVLLSAPDVVLAVSSVEGRAVPVPAAGDVVGRELREESLGQSVKCHRVSIATSEE
jgi:hypothetical protein